MYRCVTLHTHTLHQLIRDFNRLQNKKRALKRAVRKYAGTKKLLRTASRTGSVYIRARKTVWPTGAQFFSRLTSDCLVAHDGAAWEWPPVRCASGPSGIVSFPAGGLPHTALPSTVRLASAILKRALRPVLLLSPLEIEKINA